MISTDFIPEPDSPLDPWRPRLLTPGSSRLALDARLLTTMVPDDHSSRRPRLLTSSSPPLPARLHTPETWILWYVFFLGRQRDTLALIYNTVMTLYMQPGCKTAGHSWSYATVLWLSRSDEESLNDWEWLLHNEIKVVRRSLKLSKRKSHLGCHDREQSFSGSDINLEVLSPMGRIRASLRSFTTFECIKNEYYNKTRFFC